MGFDAATLPYPGQGLAEVVQAPMARGSRLDPRCDADRAGKPDESAARAGYAVGKGKAHVNNLTLIIVLGTVLHIIVFALMVWIRVRRTDTPPEKRAAAAPCAVCGAPSTYLGYDGLDPREQVNPETGRAVSFDMSHYRPLCARH